MSSKLVTVALLAGLGLLLIVQQGIAQRIVKKL